MIFAENIKEQSAQLIDEDFWLVQRAESYLDNSCHKRLALISPTKRLSQILIKEIYKEQESFF